MSKLFYQFTVYSSSYHKNVTYYFFEDGTYDISIWDDDARHKNGAKWRICNDKLEYLIGNNIEWYSFLNYDSTEEKRREVKKFVHFCTYDCML